jgi:GT2 family glycosyltransferase
MILFSVIIPVRNRPGQLRRCLEGIVANSFVRERGDDCEIIVVDNGSTDETPAVAAAFAGVRVVSEPIPNRCRARNRGAAEARGAWLVFIDSDCVAAPDWLARLAEADLDYDHDYEHEHEHEHEHETHRLESLCHNKKSRAGCPCHKVGLLAGAVLPAPPASPVEDFIARRRWIDQEKFLEPGRRFSPPFAATANLAVRRDVYLALGGLDPALDVAGEDADFCWRAARAGWRIEYVAGAAVTHEHRSTLGGLWRQAYHYGIGNADLFAKWRGEWGARAWLEPCHVVWAMKGLLKAPVRLVVGRDPLARHEPFYDFLANTAMAAGRLRGGLRHRLLIL